LRYNLLTVAKAAAPTQIALLLLLSAVAASQVLPRPQISSGAGKPAPNFTLKDEHGNSFKLGSLRGKRVLLIFYRGYW
jgi:cytochrome oxidase Cu insertion factor (SCO1/SenC/PrrC family)